jgi:hypothetical protein
MMALFRPIFAGLLLLLGLAACAPVDPYYRGHWDYGYPRGGTIYGPSGGSWYDDDYYRRPHHRPKPHHDRHDRADERRHGEDRREDRGRPPERSRPGQGRGRDGVSPEPPRVMPGPAERRIRRDLDRFDRVPERELSPRDYREKERLERQLYELRKRRSENRQRFLTGAERKRPRDPGESVARDARAKRAAADRAARNRELEQARRSAPTAARGRDAVSRKRERTRRLRQKLQADGRPTLDRGRPRSTIRGGIPTIEEGR